MSISRWLRVGAAVAAAAAVHPAAASAQLGTPTPCSNSTGVVAQGYVLTQYLQLRYDRVSVAPANSGVKVCFQVGGVDVVPGGDTYGVIDIPVPSAAVPLPETDGNHERCKEHPYNQKLYEGGSPLAATVRIDYFDGPSWDAVCWEIFDASGEVAYGGRLIIHAATINAGSPSVGFVKPSPVRDMSKNLGYAPGEPSQSCSADPGGTELINFYYGGDQHKLAFSTIDLLGTTSVCARVQDASNGMGFGGRASVDTTGLPNVSHGRDGTPCTQVLAFSDAPGAAYLRVSSSPLGADGAQSICVMDSPTNTNRITVSQSLTGVVTWTPDSDSD